MYFFRSFGGNLPWAADSSKTGSDFYKPAENYLVEDVWMISDAGATPSIISGRVFGALVFVWLVILFCLYKGVSHTSKVVYVTMPLPIVIILVLVVRGLTLEGASAGVEAYIGHFEFDKLLDGRVWAKAVGQIFFSIGICFGIMTAYASYNKRHQNTVADGLIIAFSNSAVSIVSGFAVFSVLGHIAHVSGYESIDELDNIAGISLAFMTYPVALSTLPLPGIWSACFFLTLFLLGIDSAFSMVEAVCTALSDSRGFAHIPRNTIVAVTCLFGFGAGVVFCTDVGPYLLSATDDYVNAIGMMFIGFMETYAAGWTFNFAEERAQIGLRAALANRLAWTGTCAAAIVATYLLPRFGDLHPAAVTVPAAVATVALGVAAAYSLAEEPCAFGLSCAPKPLLKWISSFCCCS